MKTYFKILLLIIYNLIVLNYKSQAQTYPVQLSTQLVPPYSGYLPDYADPSSEKLKVILQFNDFTVAQYSVRLKFEIKGNGFTLTTKQLYNPPPLQIEPGVPFLLSGADLAPYLNSNNLDFVGINQSQYEQRMALPEGYYTICVKAYDYYNNGGTVQVSNEACAQAWFTLSDPPFLNLPFCNASVTPQTPQNILFQWTPMNMGSPNSAFNTEYDFELWECRPDTNANPNQIVLSTAPIFSLTTQQTVLNYGMVEPALNLYMKYVWRVRAHDVSGRDLFKNQGYSQICTFNYGSAASVLGSALTLNLSAQAVTHRMGKCTWNTQSLFTSYKLQVRKQGTTNWFDYNTTQGSEKVTNLEPNTDYEAQVQGSGNGVTSAWSNIATFRTNNEPNYNCNDQTQLADPLQAQPLPLNKAVIGLVIQTGQFEVITTQIAPTGSPGWYSGKGYARVFGVLPLAVQWSNIYIDDNNRHQQGIIQAMTKGIDNWVHQWDVTNAQNDPEVVNGTITSFTVNNGQYCYTLQGGNNTQICDSFPSGTNVFVVRDDSGNEYTVTLNPPPPTVTGPSNYIATSPDNMEACDSLMVTFEPSQNQAFGFDAKQYTATIPNYECIKLSNSTNYFVPYKSIGEIQTDEVLANIQINNFKHSNLSFKTQSGSALTSTSLTPTQYKITGIPATANCIYAYYNNKKVGKLNIVSLKPITKKVVIVPVNGASNAITAAQLNAIYKQANVAWTLTTASAFNFNLGNDGLEAADATLFAKYSTEMRALRDAYKQANTNYDQNAYYIFVVPNFSNTQLKGYMVRGRALGFVTSNASAKEVAHELAHGAFGLEHTFPKIDKETSNNLLDYGSGETLTKEQWMDIQNPSMVLNWNDTEEDAAVAEADFPSWLERIISHVCYESYKNYDGLIPECFWNRALSSQDLAFTCGLLDGAFITVKDALSVSSINFSNIDFFLSCWTPSYNSFTDQNCKDVRNKTIEFVNTIKIICSDPNAYKPIYNGIINQFEGWKNSTFCDNNLACSYNQGRAMFNILSFLYGAAEMKAALKAGTLYTKIAQIASQTKNITPKIAKAFAKANRTIKVVNTTLQLCVKLNGKPDFAIAVIEQTSKNVKFTTQPLSSIVSANVLEHIDDLYYIDETNSLIKGSVDIVEYSHPQTGEKFVSWKKAARFIAQSGSELKTYLNTIVNKPLGKTYTGKWYRYTGNPNYNPTEIYSGMIDAENRFRKGLYLSETKAGNIIEANSYGGTGGKTLFEITNVQVPNMLDLTDINTIEALGTTFEQMKLSGITNAYEYTQEVAIWAKNNGYSGIKFFGAQGGATSYINFVIFEQATVNNAIKGSANIIPW